MNLNGSRNVMLCESTRSVKMKDIDGVNWSGLGLLRCILLIYKGFATTIIEFP